MVKVREESSGEALVMEWSGLMSRDELYEVTSLVEEWLDNHDSTRILVVLQDFEGFSVQADWARVKWQIANMSRIECVALVGPEEVANALAMVGVTTVDHPVEVFGPNQMDVALAWLKAFPVSQS